ncbi:MAG: serine/threonine-protein kinase [Gemmataceae bacterium]
MPAPATVNEFLEVMRKSGVLDKKRLDEYLRRLQVTTEAPLAPGTLADLMVRDGLVTRFQVQQLLSGKYIGFTLGHYKVLELLGSGGMSAVYLCEDQHTQQHVALKVLPKSLAQNATILKRFYREAEICANLDHPNLVRGYALDHENEQHFFVMEYVDGVNLWEIVNRFGPMPVLRAAHYIRQAAAGLQYAHEMGLVHRDIKPSNLLVNRQGVVKILDMGLSLYYTNEQDSVLTKDVLGTIEYVAPEQARDSHNVDIRADVFSLGATFYFLLTGLPPFGPERVHSLLSGQGLLLPLPIRSVRPDLPEKLANVIIQMMAPNPDKRQQTPAEVSDALTPWTREPIPPPAESEMPQLSPALRSGPSQDHSSSVAWTAPTASDAGRAGGSWRWVFLGLGLGFVLALVWWLLDHFAWRQP